MGPTIYVEFLSRFKVETTVSFAPMALGSMIPSQKTFEVNSIDRVGLKEDIRTEQAARKPPSRVPAVAFLKTELYVL